MGIVISGTGLFTPPQSISNKELVESYNSYVDLFNKENQQAISEGKLKAYTYSSEEFIKRASGIESRYVIDKKGILDPHRMKPSIKQRNNDEPSLQAEIAVSACKEALKNANKDAGDIDAIICACANLQRAYPAVAIEIQNLLGIDGYAYDMNVACSSSTFAFQNAVNDIKSGTAKSILVVDPEICSAHLNFKDRDGHFIFGDVCTASVIESSDVASSDVLYEILGTKIFVGQSQPTGLLFHGGKKRNSQGEFRWGGNPPAESWKNPKSGSEGKENRAGRGSGFQKIIQPLLEERQRVAGVCWGLN